MEIAIKRAYDKPTEEDGYRVLVDRLWPRGIKKEALAIAEWCKQIAPSTALREWFNHEPAKFEEFAVRYRLELCLSDEGGRLLKRATNKRLTLVYAAKNNDVNHVLVLRDFLNTLKT